MSRALQLKEQGNRHFQRGDYNGADSLYSQAIIADPKNPALYTNRAMSRLKLADWAGATSDCEAALALPALAEASAIKAHYYLAQARLGLGSDPEAALAAALAAHGLCAAAVNDRSLAAVTAVVLRCKKACWERRERARVRHEMELEREVLGLLRAQRDALVGALRGGGGGEDGGEADGDGDGDGDGSADVERQIIEEEARAKEERIAQVFERSRRLAGAGRREVPDWAIDDISFGFMVDPVLTKTGKSYERASIIEHLRRHASDPLTREPLVASDLRPNMALRQACEEFLKENGWAADW